MTTAYARRLRHRVLREQDYQYWLANFYKPPFLIGQLSDNRDTWWTRQTFAHLRSVGRVRWARYPVPATAAESVMAP